MLNQNLITLRKAKGFSQEELAVRLNIVRQTISKWEKGLSVPDADLLIALAEIFEVAVGELLGEQIEREMEVNAVAEQLSRINEQLAVRNHRSRRIWKIVLMIIGAFLAASMVLFLIANVLFLSVGRFETTAVESHTSVME